jgi:3',5'-nucleoside bisphosphate phosphatase
MDTVARANRPQPCLDLHSHSCHSDGLLSPTALVQRARENGVDVLALTDHDSTAGLAEARSAAAKAGLDLVDGVEISVSWGDQLIHIVGLNIDPACPELATGLAVQRRIRIERSQRIAEKFDRLGIHGSLAGATAQAGDAAPGRNHFARFLVEKGYARNTRQAFKRWLGRGGSCHVPSCWAGLDAALDWIHGAGGQAVLAHPARYGLTRTALRRFLTEFRAEGGDALEVISGQQTPRQTRMLADLARDFELRASVGSDFHAPGADWAELGRIARLPTDCIPLWQDWVWNVPVGRSALDEHRKGLC